MIKFWGSYRQSKDGQQLKTFSQQCTEVAHEIATFPLFALQQVISSLVKASELQINQQKDTKAFIKEVDWLMNQLIRGQSEQNDIFLQQDSKDLTEGLLQKELGKHASRLNRQNRPKIVVIDDQKSLAQSLCATLQDFALNTQYFTSVADFEASSAYTDTDLVLLDIVMPNINEKEVFEFATRLVQNGTKVISCSSKFTFETRLLAVRALVSDYVVKPINTYVLVEKIGRALKLQTTRKHHLVIVDDQEMMGTFYKTVLEQMGCDVTFFESAQALFESLDDLNPDMFLLDMMMPDVDGLEVAKMLRQEHKFDFAPILFLTADEQVGNRIAAIDAGADDVINKKSSVNTITSQVLTRLNRASEVRAFIAKDPLTGVLNHGQIVESANQALRYSTRRKTCSAIAVIDIDLFKKVNDSYGHIAGDKVLCALGQLMANSIRETDRVGRYGGEEFVIVFDDCKVEDAAAKVQMLKDIFYNMQFTHKKTKFSVSFSAGLVNLNDYENVQTAISFADKALYRAKEEGRNKVLMYRKTSKVDTG